MDFNFGKAKPLADAEVQAIRIKTLAAADEMYAAYENLAESYKQIDEVQLVVENLTQAINVVKKFGVTNQTVTMLNFDGGLESLFGSVENLDAKVALEEMGEQKDSLWEKFKEGCKRVIEAIKNFFEMIGKKFMELFDKINVFKRAYEEGRKEGKEEYDRTFVETIIPKGMYAILPGVIDGPLANMGKLITDLGKYAEYVFNNNFTDEMFEIARKLNNTQIFYNLKNGKFFLKSEGEPVDTWAHIGYQNPESIFKEVEKIKNFAEMLRPIYKIVSKLDQVIFSANLAKVERPEGKESIDALIEDVSVILKYAKQVSEFSNAVYRVWNSMLEATKYTLDATKEKLGVQ